jgi:hypothetical protein
MLFGSWPRGQMQKLSSVGKFHDVPSRKMLAVNAGRRPVILTKLYFRLKSCLPTASGCHFQEAAISERRRFWAAPSQANQLDRVSTYHSGCEKPSEFASSHRAAPARCRVMIDKPFLSTFCSARGRFWPIASPAAAQHRTRFWGNSRHGGHGTGPSARSPSPAAIPAIFQPADRSPRPSHRENRAAQALMPPFRLTNWCSSSESALYAAA